MELRRWGLWPAAMSTLLSTLVSPLVGLLGCGPPTLVDVQRDIFTPRCANAACHGGETPQLDLDLSEGRAFDNVVNVRARAVEGRLRVVPGRPDESLLFELVQRPVKGVRRMPVGFPLEDGEIDMLRQWIEAGAPRE